MRHYFTPYVIILFADDLARIVIGEEPNPTA